MPTTPEIVTSPDFLYAIRREGRRLYRTLSSLGAQVPSARMIVMGVPVEFVLSDTEARIDVTGTGYAWRTPLEWVTQDPTPTITAGPAPGSTLTATSATFEFASPEAGARFEARLDAGPWVPVSSPYTVSALTVGAHTLEVRVVDAAGIAITATASRSWSVAAAL